MTQSQKKVNRRAIGRQDNQKMGKRKVLNYREPPTSTAL